MPFGNKRKSFYRRSSTASGASNVPKTNPPPMPPSQPLPRQGGGFMDAIKTGAGLGIGLEAVRTASDAIKGKLSSDNNDNNLAQGDNCPTQYSDNTEIGACEYEGKALSKCLYDNYSLSDEDKLKKCEYFFKMLQMCQENVK